MSWTIWAIFIAGIAAALAGAVWAYLDLRKEGKRLKSLRGFLVIVIAFAALTKPIIDLIIRPEPSATRGQVEKLRQDISRLLQELKNPPLKEVRSEVEREITAELEVKKLRVLKLYKEAYRLYEADRYPEAVESFRAAIKVVDVPSIRFALGNSLLITGDLDGAHEQYTVSLARYRKRKNRLGEANALGNIGLVQRQLGEPGKALRSHQAALKIHRQIGNRLGEANALNNIGLVQRQRGELEKALKSFEAALRIFREIGAKREIEITKRNIAIVKAEMRKGKKAEGSREN